MYSSLKARCGVIGYEFDLDKSQTPSCRELRSIPVPYW
jgi:hypothetical protein